VIPFVAVRELDVEQHLRLSRTHYCPTDLEATSCARTTPPLKGGPPPLCRHTHRYAGTHTNSL
jgi:hypothetical protein